MKHLIGIGVRIAMAFGLRSWLQTNLALDIYIHDTYWAIPLRIAGFWCLMGTAFVGSWFLRGHRFVAIPNFPATFSRETSLCQASAVPG
jgi:hypothetical protein